MPELQAQTTVTSRQSYRFGTVEVTLPHHECDVNLRLPHGEVIALQYRLESPSIDVVMPDNVAVTNWEGDDMQPAKSIKRAHIRKAKQIVLDLFPEWVDAEPAVDESTQTETVRIVPEMTPEEAKRFQDALDAKQHAEYLCYMMLDALNRAVPLEELMKLGVRREIVSEETIAEFFGNPETDENAGCVSAENHTLPSLLKHWRESTDRMVRTISEAGRKTS